MLELHKKKNSLPPSAEREKIEREIAVTDEEVDEIVYGLYGVTEGERKVIEGEENSPLTLREVMEDEMKIIEGKCFCEEIQVK